MTDHTRQLQEAARKLSEAKDALNAASAICIKLHNRLKTATDDMEEARLNVAVARQELIDVAEAAHV